MSKGLVGRTLGWCPCTCKHTLSEVFPVREEMPDWMAAAVELA